MLFDSRNQNNLLFRIEVMAIGCGEERVFGGF